MGTVEIFIVFSALMALVALVTIGIDWIGKPLKHRRFIPRIYRFDDEKLPVDEYGHATLEPQSPAVVAAPAGYMQPAPVVVAQLPGPGHLAPGLASTPAPQLSPEPLELAARHDQTVEVAVASTGSAFTSSLIEPDPARTQSERTTGSDAENDWLDSGLVPSGSDLIARAPETRAGQPASWEPGVALDISLDGRKPSLATKAERFWMSTSASLAESSHFDQAEISRMASGKAPRRNNPRSGRTESMRLTGLRQASQPHEVRMQWPEESVDPWSSS